MARCRAFTLTCAGTCFSLPLPACGERGGVRGPLGQDEPHGQNLQRHCGNLSAQNRGEAPSPSVASLPRPLPAQRGEVKRHVRGQTKPFSRRLRARALPTTKHQNKLASGNKREAKRRKAHANHVPRSADKCTQSAHLICCAAARHIGARPPSGASPRLSQGLPSLTQLQAMLPATWNQAGVTRPILSQSSDSTSRLGRSTEGNDARSRSGADCEPEWFACQIKARSEISAEISPKWFNSLAPESECRAPFRNRSQYDRRSKRATGTAWQPAGLGS